ncbi:hypothetical protein cyc_08141 [Cyclospora cayetanensis]|uniref:Uncharacterized protein n=1 Tax=Cyclospora cayetanensis TaxID=88456 RepID=A0A1D3CR06_9EIME|nr:hypothetical protein cyc_08141 [Cyclospora cayetanensis]
MRLKLHALDALTGPSDSLTSHALDDARGEHPWPYRNILEQCGTLLAAFNPVYQTLQGLCKELLGYV